MALSNLTKVQTLGIGSNIEVVGVITTGQFKSGTSNLHSSGVELTNLNVSGIATIGGNVSIGGTLTYQDVTNIDSVGIITARSTIDAQGSINLADSIIHTGDTDTKIRFPAANTVTVETAGSERLRIASDGNMGLGTNSLVGNAANVYLTVNGSTLGGIALKANGTTQGYLQGTSSLIRLSSDGSKPITFDTNGSERVRINSSGQVGINTTVGGRVAIAVDSSNTNPLATGFIALTLKNTNTTDNTSVCMDFNNSVGGIVGRFGAQFKDTSDKDTDLYFANRADGGVLTERLRITSSGNIGAGTNNPDGFYTHAKNLVIGSGSSGEGITIFSGSSDSGFIGFNDTVSNGMQGYIQYNHNGDYMAFGPNGTEKLRIDSSGRVLIGTTTEGNSSADNLTVADSGESGITVRSGTSNGGHIYFSDATSGTAEYQGAISYQHNGDFMKFNTGATERMRLQSNGYMALNTTGAQRLFSVKESNNKASILIWRTSETNGDYSGIDFIGHPSNNGTNYQKGGIYWQTDGSGFGRGDMVFCNDGAADSDNVIISNEKLRIHKEGPVTKPNMPVASFSDSRAVDINNAVLTSSNFYNHQWWNEGSHFNTSNGRFTCPVDGVYRIYFRATCDQNEHTNVRLRKNGGTINEAYSNYSNGQTSSDSSEAIMHCSTNDYLEIQVSRLKTLGGTQHKQVTFQLLH